MNSCLYKGQISHRRHRPREHRFEYGIFLLCLDLDELDEVFAGRWFWSVKRRAVARFRRSDHLGDSNVPLKQSVVEFLRDHGKELNGPVRLLTGLRYFGYVSNPVSFFFCYDHSGENIDCIIAQVTNTPWGERHCYLMTQPTQDSSGATYHFDKAFHVSPFMQMDMRYLWRFSMDDTALRIHNKSFADGRRVVDATLSLTRDEITTASLAATLLRQPFMSFKVTAAIYFQALLLWLKGIPFVPHPSKRSDSQATKVAANKEQKSNE